MAESGTIPCPHCGFTVQASGFELISAGFPSDIEAVHRVIAGATRFTVCPQCWHDNEHVERVYLVTLAPTELVLVRPPTDASDVEVDGLLDALIPNLPDGWTVRFIRDIAEFRKTVGLMALASIRFEAIEEIVGAAPRNRPPPLSPAGSRDRAYHAALALIGMPGVVVFTYLPAGVTEEEARFKLDEMRRLQLAISFFEIFAETPLAGFDPFTAVQEHFVPACFEDEEVLTTIAILMESRQGPGDPAVIDAAIGAAGERRSPRRRELAEELVASLRQGVKLHDDPAMWRKLVGAEDVLRVILAERGRLEDAEAVNEMADIAAALGHAEEVLQRYFDRLRIGVVDDPAKLVDAVLSVAAELGSDNSVIGEALAAMASSAPREAAIALLPVLLERLERERRILAVPVARTLAKRLTDEGAPRHAVALLDHMDEALDWDAFDDQAAATRRAHLLNERGNALRSMLDAESALAAYDQALSLLEGQGHEADIRVGRLNRARALSDAGYLPRAISEFRQLIGGLYGRERFDALFSLALALQRNGQWRDAQPVLDEATELVRAEPPDDQLVRFMLARLANARALRGREETTLLAAVQKSPFVSARLQLQTLGAISAAALRTTGPGPELSAKTLQFARGLDLPALATHDPDFALAWVDAVRLAGDAGLARETVETALVDLRQPILGMHAAGVAAELAVDEGRWDDASLHVKQAAAFMTDLVGTASIDSTAVTLADTLSDVHDLSSRLVTAPVGGDYDRMLSAVADLGSSLQLSMQIARDHLPVGGDLRAPAGTSLQVLQWLDGGETQLPLLTVVDDAGTTVHRGGVLPTELVDRLGARIAGRISRSPALDPSDILEGVTPFRSFRDAMAATIAELPIDPAEPLTVVPSRPMAGIPFHATVPDYEVALSPSLAVALVLAHRAAASARQADAVGEVRCWCHGDTELLVGALNAGGEALRALCTRHQAPYEVAEDTAATRTSVAELVESSTWLKLSCHGVTDPTRAQFALVLSDGQHVPPSLPEVLDRPDYGARYLFDWSEVADTRSRCRAVISSACTSGSVGATAGGEQIGLARAFLKSGVLAFVAPLWPVAADPAQLLVNELLGRCMAEPGLPLAVQLSRTRRALRDSVPPRVADAFVLHGYAGPVNPTPEEPL
ncbi:CHAT domain-containing protein [Streptomyces sp. NPDC006872]|uniref:CHAT domain-containing protein n=1 Tax=Streptomyces sp. NPDC006872 TaxID=3155720 RepID=UPI0034037C94